MNPNTDQRSMRVYASDNTQYRTEPNEEQSRNGVVPLDSLPAAWWNWLWNEITSNNNNALLSITDLRTEIGNVLTNAGITASAQVTNQLAQAIIVIHQRKPFFDDQHNPVPGSVISSAARSSVSVDGSTGQMTVNALSDWASQDSVKTVIDNLINGGSSTIASLEQDIADLNQKTGNLANLTTTDKTNLVAAINEVDSHADSNATAISDEATARQNADSSLSQDISDEATARQNADSSLSQDISDEATARQNADGTLTNLTTTDKSNLVAAINEVDSHADSNATAISDEVTARQNADGTLTNLTTTDKSNLVAAINEVNDKANPVQYATSEFDTKKKWTDGKQIYGRVLTDFLIRFSQNTSFPTTYRARTFVVFNNTLYVGASGYGIYTSTDGVTFTQNTSFPTNYGVSALAVFNNTLCVGTAGYGIYTSTDGVTFTQNTSFPTVATLCLTVFNNTLYAGTLSKGIYTSTDGVTFIHNTSYPTTGGAQTFVVFNNTLYVGTPSRGLRTSTDGVTFTQNTAFPTNYGVNALAVLNNTLYVGTAKYGIYTSTDEVTFTQNTAFPTNYGVNALAVFNNTLYVGTAGYGIYTSTDGVTFTQNTSFPTTYAISALAVLNNTLYIGTDNFGFYTSAAETISPATLSDISELLFIQLRSSIGPLGLKSAHIDSANHLIIVGDGTPAQAIIEYTKTT